MKEAKPPDNELERLAALLAYDILDTDPEQAFDDLALLAASYCDIPIALVSLVDAERQWFKSRVGLNASSTPRNIAFCSHAILEPEKVLVIEDALKDERFADNPLVTGPPGVRFYAGAPLVTQDNFPLGTLCVIDHEPRQLSETQLQTLQALARQVVSQFELRRSLRELKDAATQLGVANQEIRNFYHSVSHELKTPLTSAREFISIMVDGIAGPTTPEQRDYLETAAESLDEMAYYINDLLDSTRLETGKLTVKLKPTAMDKVIDYVERTLRPQASAKGVELTSVLPEELPLVHADKHRITQVVANLVNNAIKFTSEGDDIVIRVEVEVGNADALRVSVCDSGCGIAEKHQARVFDRLYQAASDGDTGSGGLGLGLYICRGIIGLHGGTLEVRSRVGEGSTFEFTVPVLGATELAGATSEGERHEDHSHR